jgi:peptide-methionine (S)-S-oxide reductase
MQTIVLGGGCFWCLEAVFLQVKGVETVVSGYSGGEKQNPTYWDLHKAGNTHAEVVQITFDEAVISLQEILEIFFAIHDPTTKDQQGHDVGVEYRSIILYEDEAQKSVIGEAMQKAQKLWDNPIVTEIKPLQQFYEAEPEHQNYFEKNSSQAYCQVIIDPKLEKFRKQFKNKLKS